MSPTLTLTLTLTLTPNPDLDIAEELAVVADLVRSGHLEAARVPVGLPEEEVPRVRVRG